MTKTIGLALLSVSLGSVGQFLLKVGVNSLGGFRLSGRQFVKTIIGTLAEPHIFFGIILFATSMVVWLMVISDAELSRAYPMVSISYVFVALLSHFILGEPMSLLRVSGIAVILLGVILINL